MIAMLYDGQAGQMVQMPPDAKAELPIVFVQLDLDDVRQLAENPDQVRALLAQFLPRHLNG